MAKRIDLATRVAQETLKKSYNTLPLIPAHRVGNPFEYKPKTSPKKTDPTPPSSPPTKP